MIQMPKICQFSACQEVDRAKWQQYHMMRQDYESLFYRKLNYIVMLEDTEQAYRHRQILMISHRDTTLKEGKKGQLGIHPVTYLAKEMVKHNQKLKTQFGLMKSESQLKIEIGRLQIDQKCLIQQIKIFNQKIQEMVKELCNSIKFRQVQQKLLQHAKKYNLSTVVSSFVLSIKQIVIHNFLHENINNIIKKFSHTNGKYSIKYEDLKLDFIGIKNKAQILEDLNLYLKEFKSITVYKQMSEILNSFMQTYHRISLSNNYYYQKLIQQIEDNVRKIARIRQNLYEKINKAKDYRIKLEILIQETNDNKIQQLQRISEECISEEAKYLAMEYEQITIPKIGLDQIGQSTQDYYQYFHEHLKQKYQQFIKNQLEDAEYMQILKQKIENQSQNLEKLKNILHQQSLYYSQLQTHRTIQESVYSQFSCILKQKIQQNNQKPQKSERYQSKKTISFHSVFGDNNQKYIVKKFVNIRDNGQINDKSRHKNIEKIYEVDITKRFLILQQTTSSSLRLNQKIEISRIKAYNCKNSQNLISFDCGVNSIKLQFISNNLGSFIAKLQKIFKQMKLKKYSSFNQR